MTEKTKSKISATIIADSRNEFGERITTFILTCPRIIWAELLTHRVFSRNAASSRAIPYKKLCEAVKKDTFIPIAWQKNHKGMQGIEYHNEFNVKILNFLWKMSMRLTVFMSNLLSKFNATKQLCNRLLEPYQWYTSIVTATELDNFFKLRCPQYEMLDKDNKLVKFRSRKDVIANCIFPNQNEKFWRAVNKGQAEIHLMKLAECMWDAYNESTPEILKENEWHIPFKKLIQEQDIFLECGYDDSKDPWFADFTSLQLGKLQTQLTLQVATAMCARVSYTVVGDKDKKPNLKKDVELFKILSTSGHWSPFEHCAKTMSKEEYNKFIMGSPIKNTRPYIEDKKALGWCNNFKGFIQLRHYIENGGINY